MGEQIASVISVLIPVVAIVFGIAAAMFGMYVDYLKKRDIMQSYHAERMAAIEKGIELPPLPEALLHGQRTDWRGRPLAARSRRTGLILLFLGGAITLALWGQGNPAFWWGFVPVALGIAFVIAAALESREQHRKSPEPPSGAPPPGVSNP
jgi:hypothetical protein